MNPNQTPDGAEIPDSTPIVIEVKGRTLSQFDQVRNFIRQELSNHAASQGGETFDEANDFDVEDDLFPVSAHEYSEDTERSDRETLAAGLRSPQDNPPSTEGDALESNGEDEGPREPIVSEAPSTKPSRKGKTQ